MAPKKGKSDKDEKKKKRKEMKRLLARQLNFPLSLERSTSTETLSSSKIPSSSETDSSEKTPPPPPLPKAKMAPKRVKKSSSTAASSSESKETDSSSFEPPSSPHGRKPMLKLQRGQISKTSSTTEESSESSDFAATRIDMLMHIHKIMKEENERTVPYGHRKPHPKLTEWQSVSVYDDKGNLIAHSEGNIITPKAYQYVRKVQIEARTSGCRKELRNIYFDPEEHLDKSGNKILNCPVFIGNNGEPIAIYDKNPLGQGGFGAVYIGLNLDTGETCAVKVIQLHSKSSSRVEEEREGTVLKSLGRHIDTLLHTTKGKRTEYQVQEMIWGKNLHSFIKDAHKAKTNELSLQDKIEISHKICEAISNFHHNGYLHRDLKLENIMWDPETRECKLIDFGLSTYVGDKQSYMDVPAGTRLYKPPELSTTGKVKFSEKTDVYSLGITLAILFSTQTQKDVHENIEQLQKKAGDKKVNSPMYPYVKESLPEIFDERSTSSDLTTEAIKQMIRKMTAHDPTARPTMQEITHFFEKVRSEKDKGLKV